MTSQKQNPKPHPKMSGAQSGRQWRVLQSEEGWNTDSDQKEIKNTEASSSVKVMKWTVLFLLVYIIAVMMVFVQ